MTGSFAKNEVSPKGTYVISKALLVLIWASCESIYLTLDSYNGTKPVQIDAYRCIWVQMEAILLEYVQSLADIIFETFGKY